MTAVTPRIRGSTVTLVLTLAALSMVPGCAATLRGVPRPSLTGCGGLFTTIALPYVTRAEQRALEEAVPRLTASALNLRLRRNYYRILDQEQGRAIGESREAFVDQMLSEERSPPGLLAGVQPTALRFAVAPPPERLSALRRAILSAQAPLARRLDRVAARMTSITRRPEVTCRLDARLRLNAGAEVGFDSRQILVGPSLVLLAESDDALAFVIGHELAHIVHYHTKLKALQDLFIRAMTFGYVRGAAGETSAGILSQGLVPAFDRDQECVADYYALQYMRAAGYRPEAATAFWRMQVALRPIAPRQLVPFISLYPPPAERVLRLARWAKVDVLRDSPPIPLFEAQSTEASGAPTTRDLSPGDAVESFGVVLEGRPGVADVAEPK